MKLNKSLRKLSFYKILINNFRIKTLSERVQEEIRIPIDDFFESINFKYEFKNESFQRNHNWLTYLIMLILLSNCLKCLAIVFLDPEDRLTRLYFGNLWQYFGLDTSFMDIPITGSVSYAFLMFCLFHFVPDKHLKWLKIFNPINGNGTFKNIKIVSIKSAKKLIRFSFLLLICSITINSMSFLTAFLSFSYFPFVSLNLKDFCFYAFPYYIFSLIWIYYVIGYEYGSLFITITSYYYQLRLHELDVYVSWYLKRKRFNQINQFIYKLLHEYNQIINDVNQFNKFGSKSIFFILLFNSSTIVFLIYNMIYVKLDLTMYSIHLMFIINLAFPIILIMLRAIKLSSQFHRNKLNLIKLNYKNNLHFKTRFKVSISIERKLNNFFTFSWISSLSLLKMKNLVCHVWISLSSILIHLVR